MNKARDLVILAMDNGWSVMYKPDVDTGDNPFVTVEGARPERYFRITWHTRGTGTYRLFDAALGTARWNARAATLTSILEAVAA